MADRPDFAAIAAHQRALRPLGGGLTVDYLDQVVRYVLELEQALADVRDARCPDPRARAAEALPPRRGKRFSVSRPQGRQERTPAPFDVVQP